MGFGIITNVQMIGQAWPARSFFVWEYGINRVANQNDTFPRGLFRPTNLKAGINDLERIWNQDSEKTIHPFWQNQFPDP